MNSIDRPMIPLGEAARALEVSTDVLKSEITVGNLKCAMRVHHPLPHACQGTRGSGVHHAALRLRRRDRDSATRPAHRASALRHAGAHIYGIVPHRDNARGHRHFGPNHRGE